MKIRSDFVSNSSSSSYIVSVPKSLGLEAFSQQLADNCSCAVDEYHDDGLISANKRKLDFCLNTYELLFFGRLTMGEIEKTTSFSEIAARSPSATQAEQFWEMMTKPVYESIYRNAFEDDRALSKDYVDEENRVMHVFEPQVIDRIVVDKYTLCDFVQWGMNHSKTQFDNEHFEALKNKLEDVYKDQDKKDSFKTFIDLYQITQNTIRVTEALKRHMPGKLDTSSGYKKTEKLYNSIKAHIKNGDSVCFLTINYSGGGIDAYSIYQEDGSRGLHEISDVEILGSEAE